MTPAAQREIAVAALAGDLCGQCGLPRELCDPLAGFSFALRWLDSRPGLGPGVLRLLKEAMDGEPTGMPCLPAFDDVAAADVRRAGGYE